ncbi:MAG: PorT family protein [Bacteroidetes bacterium]|nr:PorT family protein [Bacteroidota bacterium]
MRQKLFIVTLPIVLHLMSAKAQLFVGPVAGGSLSKAFFFDQPNNSDLRSKLSLGFDAGVMAQIRVHKNFCLNAQLLYAYRTKHIEGTNGATRSDNEAKIIDHMQYIELPIFYILEFKNLTGKSKGKGGKTKAYDWFIGGGPTISYWMSNKGTLRSSYLLENQIDHVNYTSLFGRDNTSFESGPGGPDDNKENISSPNRYQFAINITGGVAFEPIGFRKIVTSVSVNIAQTYLGKSDGYYPISFVDSDPMKVKNHNIRISVAYLFDTKLQDRKKGKSTIKDVPSRRRK